MAVGLSFLGILIYVGFRFHELPMARRDFGIIHDIIVTFVPSPSST